MKLIKYNTIVLLLATLGLMSISGAVTAGDAGPAAVVTRFNQAITEQDLDTALEQLADGSVHFQLRPSHSGMGDGDIPLTVDLRQSWQMVGTLLFSATAAYTRSAEILSVEEYGDIATIWTNTSTETLSKNNEAPINLQFSEVYLLVKKDGAWKIAANADNRKPVADVEKLVQPGGDD